MGQPADQAGIVRLLLIEPEQAAAERLGALLAGAWLARFAVRPCASAAEAEALLRAARYDAVVAAVPADPAQAADVVGRLAAASGAPVIALGTEPEAALAPRLVARGAEDYLSVAAGGLAQALPRAVVHAVRRRELAARHGRLSHQNADIEALLGAILKAVHTPLVVTDEAGAIMMSSPAMTACFGWAAGELAGQPLARFLAEPSADAPAAFRCADDSTVEVAVASLPLALDGRRRAVVTFDLAGGYRAPADAEPETPIAERLLAQLAARPDRLIAGHLQLVSLDAIRAALGARWETAAERIYSSAETVLRARLTPEDVFARTAQGDFVLCFAALDESAAWYKAKAIEKEICHKLIGQGFPDALATAQIETVTISLSADELDAAEDHAALLLAKLTRAIEVRRRHRDRLLRHVCETSDIVFDPVLTARGVPSRLMVARLTDETRKRLDDIADIDHDPALIAQVDLAVIGRVADHVAALPRQIKPACFIAPLRFATLYQRGQRERLMELLRHVPHSVRANLGFSIEAIPGDIGAARVAALIGMLSVFGRLQMARLPEHLIGRHLLDGALVRIVAMDHAAFADLARLRALDRVRGLVHDAKARLLVDAIPDDAAAAAVVQAGIDLIAFTPSAAPADAAAADPLPALV